MPNPRKRIAVIGDLMMDVDNFLTSVGESENRPKCVIGEIRVRLGAAGGVANMVAALGCEPVLVSVAHIQDIQGIRRLLPGFCSVLGSDVATTRRERFWLKGEPFGARIDHDGIVPPNKLDRNSLVEATLACGPQAIIVCDHAKGVIDATTVQRLVASGIPVMADGHINSDWSGFSGVECLCMNRSEALAAVQSQSPVEPKQTIQHCDKDGLWWYRAGWWLAKDAPLGDSDTHRLWFPTVCRNLVDSLGAGDQFIATLAASRINGMDWETAIFHSNVAAGLQCERAGVVPVTFDQICERMKT